MNKKTVGRRSLRAIMALAALGIVGFARAEEGATWTAAEVAATSPCECVKRKMCWAAVLAAYKMNTRTARNEVEGALPNRFFVDSEAVALERPDAEGNFLLVRCGADHAVCGDKRDELQRRLIFTSFLSALPVDRSEGILFEPRTWALTENGERIVAKVRHCNSSLLGQLVGTLTRKKAG